MRKKREIGIAQCIHIVWWPGNGLSEADIYHSLGEYGSAVLASVCVCLCVEGLCVCVCVCVL